MAEEADTILPLQANFLEMFFDLLAMFLNFAFQLG